MAKVLPRKHRAEVKPSVFIRTRNPADRRQFDELLPWFTPLFVYHDETHDIDWVRWSVPEQIAAKWGIDGPCQCCGDKPQTQGEHNDYLVDTAWHETDWWLEANGYSNPDAPKIPTEKREGGPL